MSDDCKLEVSTSNIKQEEGGMCEHLPHHPLFSVQLPDYAVWIHEIIIIVLMIATSHSAEIGTNQIVMMEM